MTLLNTIKQLGRSVREFKTAALQTPVLVIGEVIFEALIPYTIAMLVNEVKAGRGIDRILHYAWILILMSLASLLFGYLAGLTDEDIRQDRMEVLNCTVEGTLSARVTK